MTSGGAGGETSSGAASSIGGEAGADGEAGGGGEAPGTGGSGGIDSLNYVPVQRREDGLWPDLDQILPYELGDNDAKCRITHRASEGGKVIQSWTWQYNESNGQPIRLTHIASESGDSAAVFDEDGHYWSVCDCKEPEYRRCILFEEPRSVNWNAPDDYELTCPGTPPKLALSRPQATARCPRRETTLCARLKSSSSSSRLTAVAYPPSIAAGR